MASVYSCVYFSLHVIVPQERLHWTHEWNNIVFSDESRYCWWAHGGDRRVRPYSGSYGVGAISYGSFLVFVDRSLNANRYFENILEPVLVLYLNDLQNSTFQEDNARPHMIAIIGQFFDSSHFSALVLSFSRSIAHRTRLGHDRC